ncbi:MAG: extracellular solute-binding protein [Candidatus Bathyarchaeia archaeon]|nr:extracellular solute-binding protein [Candidatus Bathyarchaeota archaeon]
MSEEKKVSRRSWVKYAGAGVVVVAAAAGAGYYATQPKPTPTPTPTTPTPTTPTPTPTPTPGRRKIRALYMSTYAPALNDWLKARTYEWAAKKGVDVEMSVASYMEILPKILTGVESKDPPDIALGAGTLVALMAEDPKARNIVPIDDVLNEIGKDDVLDEVKKWYTIDGKVYGIDLFLFVNLVHLIKPFADEVGRKPENLKTIDDYVEFAREVKKKHPEMYPMGYTLGKCYDGCETWMMFWWPYGGKLTTGRSAADLKYKSKESYDTLQKIVGYVNEGLISTEMLRADEMLNNNAYLTRTAAWCCEGPTPFYAAVTRNPKLASETLLLPAPRGPAGLFHWGSKEAMVIFKDSKNIDLAKDLLAYIFKDRKAYSDFIGSGYYAAYPVFKSTLEEYAKKDPIWAMVAEGTKGTITDYTYPLMEPCGAADEVMSKFIFADAFADALVDKKPVEQAVDNTYNKIREIFLRYYGK